MKLLFSETSSDYSRYLYQYMIWATPEPGESPGDFFRWGFLPASPRLDVYYICRNLRVNLCRFQPSSENRRILRKGEGLQVELIPRAEFEYTAQRRERWRAFADDRFGKGVMPFTRLDTLMCSPVISHLLHFTETATGRDAGTALMFLEQPALAYYYYAFYDLEMLARNLGMYMMTRAVGFFAAAGYQWLHLGTCYSDRALYKTQFAGVEFFNGFKWSSDMKELKFILRRDLDKVGKHLLDLEDYRTQFYEAPIGVVGASSQFQWKLSS